METIAVFWGWGGAEWRWASVLVLVCEWMGMNGFASWHSRKRQIRQRVWLSTESMPGWARWMGEVQIGWFVNTLTEQQGGRRACDCQEREAKLAVSDWLTDWRTNWQTVPVWSSEVKGRRGGHGPHLQTREEESSPQNIQRLICPSHETASTSDTMKEKQKPTAQTARFSWTCTSSSLCVEDR